MKTYHDFLQAKEVRSSLKGFTPTFLPDYLKDFQGHLVDWSVQLGRSAVLADCGLGKSIISLVWAENIVRHTKGRVLLVCPLAVSRQFVREAEKFGLKCTISQDGKLHKGINVTNYERLKNFRQEDFQGLVLDESSILKGLDGKFRKHVTKFMRPIRYGLLCTATPAPNDFMELGTSSEALGNMTHSQMLSMFFTNDGESTQQWTLKGHAKTRFWQWVGTWARALRRPSDLGFDDTGYILPELKIEKHILPSVSNVRRNTFLLDSAKTMNEQRKEQKATLKERCEMVASLVPKNRPCVIWCHLNAEGNLLEQIIPGAVQVQGSDKEQVKEDRLVAFSEGRIQTLVTKSKIAGFGLNWQHCSDICYFPSHSYEQFYQAVRRCWRFGQKKPVTCHLVSTEKNRPIIDNMLLKERKATEMYAGIVKRITGALKQTAKQESQSLKLPAWIK